MSLLARFLVVLHRPRDLVNIAMVIRAMRNMGLERLRLVRPEEFDPRRIEGIAHGTADLIATAERVETLEEAVRDAVHVVGTTARRRSARHRWWTAPEAAPALLDRAREGPVALVFGPEDRGLSNEELDLCHALLTVPANPEHPSLNLSHAALLVFYELWKESLRRGEAMERDLSPGADHEAPPARAEDLEEFFEVWQRALERVGFFHGIAPGPKMRTFRSLFQRAELDRREVELLKAAAYEIIHYERRTRTRLGLERRPGEDDEDG